MKLEDIVAIEPGLVTTRKKASNKFEVEAVYQLLTLNAIGEYGGINRDKLLNFASAESLNDRYFTKKEDILVRLNEPFTAVYIDASKEGILIPSYFVKLSVINKKFKAAYIAWYLNREKVKRAFLRSQSGTLVPSINQKVIRQIDVEVKTIDEQEEILRLYHLHQREVSLMKKLIDEKEKQFKGLTEKLLKKEGERHVENN